MLTADFGGMKGYNSAKDFKEAANLSGGME